jgi:hypothetical protein
MRTDRVRKVAPAAIVAAGAIACWSAPALGHDLDPPPWERFVPFTTFQEWDFNQPGTIPPDGDAPGNWYNEGKANDTPLATPGVDLVWHDIIMGDLATRTGLYEGLGDGMSYIDFFVPNWIDEEPLKWIWIQINGVWQPGSAPPFVQFITGEDSGNAVDGIPLEAFDFIPGEHRTEWWEMRPNPDFETIRIYLPDAAFVDQVVIDTISFPAPGAIGLLAVAGLAASRRRR